MLLQRSKKLHRHIQEDGCALMCLAMLTNQITNRDMPPGHINSVYLRALKTGIMKEQSFIQDWKKVAHELGVDLRYLGHKSPEWEPKEDEFEILLWYYKANNWWHFTNGDGKGNVYYDPWGRAGPGFRMSKTATLGELVGKRGFSMNGSVG